MRRQSIPISPTLAPVGSVPIPKRHGSISQPRPCIDVGSFGSVFSEASSEQWLDTPAEDVLAKGKSCPVVVGDMGTEEAVEILLQSGSSCLLVHHPDGFFDYADLNAFLLLILQAPTSAALDPRSHKIASSLRRGVKVTIGELCDLSQKSPFYTFPSTTPLRTLLPIFASGVHRIAIGQTVLTETLLLQHIIAQHSLPDMSLPISHPALGLALSAVVCLYGAASVLDAMQVMSLRGLGALGVTTRHRSGSSSSNSSSSSDSESDLCSVITARDCTSLVVPSEGKEVLGESLAHIVKTLQQGETAGQARGEERFPVHTITPDMSLLHTCHLLLATSSSRVFVRRTATPPSSPLDADSLPADTLPGLPTPPPTLLSANQIVCISDVLASLAKRYHLKPHVAQDIDPASLGRRRRLSTSASGGMSVSWRWAT